MSIKHDFRPNAARPSAEKNSAEPSVLEHAPEKPAPHLMRDGSRFSLATNAVRLRGDHARTISQSAVMIHPDVIAPQHSGKPAYRIVPVDDARIFLELLLWVVFCMRCWTEMFSTT
jgi:hypothetical protein